MLRASTLRAPTLGALAALAVLAAVTTVAAVLPSPAAAAPDLAERWAAVRPYPAFNDQGSVDQQLSSPALGDVTGDGAPEIVVGGMDGTLRALDPATGAEVRAVVVDPGAMIQAAPTLVDIDGDPALEVATATVRVVPGASGVKIYDFASSPPTLVFNQGSWDGAPLSGFVGSPVVADITGDGAAEVIAVGFDHHLHAWRLDGSYLPGFPVHTFDTAFATPAVADVDGDGIRDVVVGVDMDFGQPFPPGGYLWAVRGDGHTVPGYPFRLSTEVVWSSAAVGDVDADGDPDVVVGTGRNFGTPEARNLYAVDARARAHLPGWPRVLDAPSMASPALANLDGDAQLEVVTVSGTGRVYAFDHDGTQRWATCARAVWAGDCPADAAIVASPAVADLDADGSLEVVVAGERELVVLDAAGGAIEARVPTISTTERYTWPGANAPAVGTVGGRTLVVAHLLVDNGDDVRGPGDSQGVWAWDAGPAGGALPWAQFHGGPRHLGHAVVVGPGGFTDTAGHPHAGSIAKVAAAGIAGGYPDGTYKPEWNVSRAQMAAFLVAGYDLPPASSPTFPDAVGTTHEANIRALAAAGITVGDAQGRFRPSDEVTRGEMAVFLARAEGLPLDGGGPTFCDIAGHDFAEEIRAVAAAGIAAGRDDGCYHPDAPVTRGQMATFLTRALDL